MTGLLDDLAEARWDVPFFAKRFLAIDVHADQERFFNAIVARNATGWRPANLTICCSAGNRAGKTLAMAIAIVHACIFKMNMRPPDWLDPKSVEAWMRSPYDWWHFGIQQEVAELVHAEVAKIFDSRHEAQRGALCPMIDELGPDIVKFDVKERGDYSWVRFSPIFGGAEIHFRSTTERALGQLGKAMQGISMDECGFERNLPFLINEVFQMRRLSTGGQLFLISTPSEGFTEFTDEWMKGDPANPLRLPSHFSMYMSTRTNVGYGIARDMFDQLVASMPPELIPQNIDGHFLQGSKSFFNQSAVDHMFVQSELEDVSPFLPERSLPSRGHRYIQGLDPALTYDNTWSIVVDITDRSNMIGVHVRKLTGRQTTLSVTALAHDNHAAYNNEAKGYLCTSGVDVTGFGGKVFREQLQGIKVRGVEFGGSAKTKLKLLMDLKGVIEQGKLRFPRKGLWLELRRQLLAYRLDDRKIEQDAVMALAIAVKLALRTPEGASSVSLPFSYFQPDDEGPRTNESKFWRDLRRRGTVQKLGAP